MKNSPRNRYESIPKRNFKNAIIKLLEDEYKIVGSHKVINLIATDIITKHKEFYPTLDDKSLGTILWKTTKSGCNKPSYGTKVEDYETITVKLPLVMEEDVDYRISRYYTLPNRFEKNNNYKKSRDRDIIAMARLVKSAYKQGGLLTGAEISVLLNRSLTTISRYMKVYHETHTDILPTKGMILDQGSKPTHKASIIHLYEQGYPEVDVARFTNHTIDSTSRYLKNYKRIKLLVERKFNLIEMVRTLGLGQSTIVQYRDILFKYHPKLKRKKENKKIGKEDRIS